MNDRVFQHAHAHKLEDPERLKWLPPSEVLSRLHLSAGLRVADVGAGTGYFSIPIAKAIADAGEVFAVDVQQEMLDKLRQKLEQPDSPRNISLHLGAASQLPLRDDSVDLAFYANIWHELDDQKAALREAVRVTTAKGKIALLDWRSDKEPPPGPPQQHRIPAETIVGFLQASGCHRVSCYNVGQYNYFVTAELAQE
ncbi:MAG TPA: methyltransferase domain-containing protein [Terriglobales bacterium]|jgi:ubiquinone/menaquinone biosynthesis C-methylase UbiE